MIFGPGRDFSKLSLLSLSGRLSFVLEFGREIPALRENEKLFPVKLRVTS